ncbi:MAG: TraM recognition domain-containing protein, partial [Sulfolobales archaeon]
DLGREFVLVVDEAHRFLRKGRALSKLFREGRKYGISSILITQDVNSIPRELLLNAATLISFSLPEISTARYVAKIVSPDDADLYEKILGKLTSLPQFYALVFIPGLGSYIVDTRKPNPTR